MQDKSGMMIRPTYINNNWEYFNNDATEAEKSEA